MKTCLDAYCEIKGWQGGTIHQCYEDFDKASPQERDRICSYLVDNRSLIDDLKTVSYFTKRRMELTGLVIQGVEAND